MFEQFCKSYWYTLFVVVTCLVCGIYIYQGIAWYKTVAFILGLCFMVYPIYLDYRDEQEEEARLYKEACKY